MGRRASGSKETLHAPTTRIDSSRSLPELLSQDVARALETNNKDELGHLYWAEQSADC